MHKGHFAYGTAVGTGAAMNFAIGFQPDWVEIFNLTSRDELKWQTGMTAAHGFKRVAAGTGTAITSGGISLYAGVDGTTAVGFTLGTDADMNVVAEVLYWKAGTNDA